MAEGTVDDRIDAVIARLDRIDADVTRIKKQLRKKVEERKMNLKEKFSVHDRAQRLLNEFESLTSTVIIPTATSPYGTFYIDNKRLGELREVVKNLTKLIDYVLGVRYP